MQPVRLKPAVVLTKAAAYVTDGEPVSHDVPAHALEPVPAPSVEAIVLPETGGSDEIIDWGTPPPEELPVVESVDRSLEESPDPFADE
jgi:hypothetical protein